MVPLVGVHRGRGRYRDEATPSSPDESSMSSGGSSPPRRGIIRSRSCPPEVDRSRTHFPPTPPSSPVSPASVAGSLPTSPTQPLARRLFTPPPPPPLPPPPPPSAMAAVVGGHLKYSKFRGWSVEDPDAHLRQFTKVYNLNNPGPLVPLHMQSVFELTLLGKAS